MRHQASSSFLVVYSVNDQARGLVSLFQD